jgi:hypothetical protein
MKILVINGYPRSGKDTFAEYLSEFWKATCCIESTVSIPKDIAKTYFNWNGEKTPKMREFLSKQKILLDSYFDLTGATIDSALNKINIMSQRAKEPYMCEPLLILHCREPEKIKEIQERYDNVTTLFIMRDKAKHDALEQQTNSADLNVENFEYDIYVGNNESLSRLKESARWVAVTLGRGVRSKIFEIKY